MYNIIRKHSADHAPSIVGTAPTKKEARAIIKKEMQELAATQLPHEIKQLGDVTNIRFNGPEANPWLYPPDKCTCWSVGMWFEDQAKEPWM